MLALKVVENKPGAVGARPGFYQFGLTPEDEASQVARRAYSEGGRALIIAPNSAWGARLSGAYNKAWQDLGGSVLAQIPIPIRRTPIRAPSAARSIST